MKSLVKRSWSTNLQLPKEWRAAAPSPQPSVTVGAYLSLLSYARSQYETKSSHPQRRWVLGLRLRGSCCSLGWRSRRSWGSAEEWGLCHSGTRSSDSGCHPSPLSVLLLLYPYIAHSPLSKFLPKTERRHVNLDAPSLPVAWLWKRPLDISTPWGHETKQWLGLMVRSNLSALNLTITFVPLYALSDGINTELMFTTQQFSSNEVCTP